MSIFAKNSPMCTKTRGILNRTKSLNGDYMKIHLEVPCGKCPECMSLAQNEWFLRVQEEVRLYNKLNGRVIFFTNTYNSKCLPKFKYQEESDLIPELTGRTYCVPCFNHKDVRSFMRGIWNDFMLGRSWDKVWNKKTKKWEKSYIFKDKPKRTQKELSMPVRYIITSEYGMSEGSTNAPHYHGLLFLPPEFNDYFSSDDKVRRFLQKNWKRGFVRKSPEFGWYCKNEFAAEYVSKYMCKDVEYFSQPLVNAFLDTGNIELNKKHREFIKKYLPRHFQSMSFGATLAESVTDEDLIKGKDFSFSKDMYSGSKKRYKVPRYIERKLLYYTNEHGQLKLNERGIKVKTAAIQYKIDKLAERLQKYVDYQYISERIHNSDYTDKPLLFGLPLEPTTIITHFYRFLNHRSFTQLAIYALIWRGRFLSKQSYSARMTYQLLHKIDNIQDLSDLSLEYYSECLVNERTAVFCEDGVFYSYTGENPVYCDERANMYHYNISNIPCFKYFDEFLSLVQDIESHYQEYKLKLRRQFWQEKKNLKLKIKPV